LDILNDLLKTVLINPPVVTLQPDSIFVGKYRIALTQVDPLNKGDSFQVYNPSGEVIAPETSFFNIAIMELVQDIITETMEDFLHNYQFNNWQSINQENEKLLNELLSKSNHLSKKLIVSSKTQPVQPEKDKA